MDLVVAVTDNWGIGFGGTQTVVIPEDRKYFRALTKGSTVILGRRTLMDFPGAKPLPKRRNIILTSDGTFPLRAARSSIRYRRRWSSPVMTGRFSSSAAPAFTGSFCLCADTPM